MRCPSCRKDNSTLIDAKPIEKGFAIKRRRACLCGYEFETFESSKKYKKRKTEARTYWHNYRFNLYIVHRFWSIWSKAWGYDKKRPFNSIKVNKTISGRTEVKVVEEKNGKENIKEKFYTETRKDTIRTILAQQGINYWKQRKSYFKDKDMSLEAMQTENQKNNEIREFNKSLQLHINNEEKYNKEYISNLFKSKKFHTVSKGFLEDSTIWSFWKKIR